MKHAARAGDFHQCPSIEGGEPHVGGPLDLPGIESVLIGGLPAARFGDSATCAGPPDRVRRGAPEVLIEGIPAARRTDGTTHGGVIMAGSPMVIMGGYMPPASDAEAIEDAMNEIRASDFSKTPEGQKALAKLEQMCKDGKVSFQRMRDRRGEYDWTAREIHVDDEYHRDPDSTASELVHEATHGLEADEHGSHKNTIDEEMRTNTNQLDLYEEQREAGFRDRELERRRTARANGTLRDDVRSRYPNTPEH
jgi:uncharacterized Zn-binding protein involved in type VI secretion